MEVALLLLKFFLPPYVVPPLALFLISISSLPVLLSCHTTKVLLPNARICGDVENPVLLLKFFLPPYVVPPLALFLISISSLPVLLSCHTTKVLLPNARICGDVENPVLLLKFFLPPYVVPPLALFLISISSLPVLLSCHTTKVLLPNARICGDVENPVLLLKFFLPPYVVPPLALFLISISSLPVLLSCHTTKVLLPNARICGDVENPVLLLKFFLPPYVVPPLALFLISISSLPVLLSCHTTKVLLPNARICGDVENPVLLLKFFLPPYVVPPLALFLISISSLPVLLSCHTTKVLLPNARICGDVENPVLLLKFFLPPYVVPPLALFLISISSLPVLLSCHTTKVLLPNARICGDVENPVLLLKFFLPPYVVPPLALFLISISSLPVLLSCHTTKVLLPNARICGDVENPVLLLKFFLPPYVVPPLALFLISISSLPVLLSCHTTKVLLPNARICGDVENPVLLLKFFLPPYVVPPLALFLISISSLPVLLSCHTTKVLLPNARICGDVENPVLLLKFFLPPYVVPPLALFLISISSLPVLLSCHTTKVLLPNARICGDVENPVLLLKFFLPPYVVPPLALFLISISSLPVLLSCHTTKVLLPNARICGDIEHPLLLLKFFLPVNVIPPLALFLISISSLPVLLSCHTTKVLLPNEAT